MHTNAQVEAWVLQVIEVVTSGGKNEDGLVELKGGWPSPEKSARRLAGHANAARGESILWIIGLDEKTHRVCPLGGCDLADWWAQVSSYFDGPIPSLRDLVVSTPGGSVHALLLDTERSPYVVKNAAFGKREAGSVEREVPWREGTALRSATHQDLVRLLVPLLQLPEIRVLCASVSGFEESESKQRRLEADSNELEKVFIWSVWMELYVTAPQDTHVVLPLHMTEVSLRLEASDIELPVDFYYETPNRNRIGGAPPESPHVEATPSEAIVHLAGRLIVRGTFLRPFRDVLQAGVLTLKYATRPARADRELRAEARLLLVQDKDVGEMRWEMPPDSPSRAPS